MAKKRSNLKFLSQSVLLEEAGLPRVNTLIILVVFTMVVSFIAWANVMEIDEVVAVNGVVVQEKSADLNFSFRAQIPSREIGNISEGFSVVMNIPGVTEKKPVTGKIELIKKIPATNQQGVAYYEAIVKPGNDKEMLKNLDEVLLDGMETKVEIIVGSRTLFQYLLGPVFSARENAFK